MPKYDYHVVTVMIIVDWAGQNSSLFVKLLKQVLCLVYFKYAYDVFVAQLLL